jgi:hypothetical protein
VAFDWRNASGTVVVLAVLATVGYWRIVDSGRKGHTVEASFEVEELADGAIVSQLFEVARAELAGRTLEGPSGLSGRRVFLCAYESGPMPPCGMAEAEDLTAAVRAAAADLSAQGVSIGADTRLKMDFSVFEETVAYPAGGITPHDVGMYGYLVDTFDGTSWILPSEVLESGIYSGGEGQRGGVKGKTLIHLLKRRNSRIGTLSLEGFDYVRVRTTAWVEDASREGVFRTYRLHAWAYPQVEPERLLQRAVWASDYLLSSIDEDGRIRYLYDPTYDRILPGYNLLRHGGTTYSLLQAYQRTGFEAYRRGAEAAIGFLLKNTRTDERQGPYGGGTVRYVVESSHIKLGGAGLGLVMLAEYQLATGAETYVEQARELARFLVSQQKEDGEFVYFANQMPGGEPRDDTSAYYPGEAILGLAKQHALDGDPLWLETAERGAMWLIEVRDAGITPRKLANDHWLMIALSHLYEITGKDVYLQHSLALATAVRYQQERHESHVRYHRDYAGGYYEPPRSTPAATRGEGLVAVLDTCLLAEVECDWVREILKTTVQHEMQCQYTPDQLWWVKNRSRTLGAFHGGIVDVQVRNDYTQHNLSSILGTERHLRAPSSTLPGGPTWTRDQASKFSGLSSDVMGQLRAQIMEVRPSTRFDDPVVDEAASSGAMAP